MKLGKFCTAQPWSEKLDAQVVHVGYDRFDDKTLLYLDRSDGMPIWADEAGALALAEMICRVYDKEIVKVYPDCEPIYQARRA